MRFFLSLTIVAGLSVSLASADSVFTFDSNSPGTYTTFTDTVGTLSATFISPTDPGSFVVVPASSNSFQSPMSGNVLEDPGPLALPFLPLYVIFNQVVNSVTIDFATDGPSTFLLGAFNNANFVGLASAVGTVPIGGIYPQGTISLSGAFNILVMADATSPYFAIDNVAVTTPEPASIALIGAGLLALGGFERLRHLRPRA